MAYASTLTISYTYTFTNELTHTHTYTHTHREREKRERERERLSIARHCEGIHLAILALQRQQQVIHELRPAFHKQEKKKTLSNHHSMEDIAE